MLFVQMNSIFLNFPQESYRPYVSKSEFSSG